MCCKSPAENNILDLVYIAGIHDDPEILRADSFFLKGKLEEAAELFTKYKPDVSKQLYCQARLAEMDYYLRILYGYNHSSLAVTADKLPLVNNSINTFYYAVYKFFQDETLNDTLFRSQLNKIEKVLGKNHYLVRKGQNILGEYFYRINFNLDSTTLYFREYSTWLESQQINIYDGYWTKIRLTRIGTFFRDHIESMLNVNNLLTDPTWRKLLDNVHQAYAYSKRASIFYRFDKYEEAYLDNKLAASLSEATKAIPVYQEALKSQLVVANFWLNDTLWDFNLKLLLNSVKDSGYDYVNVDKYIGSYYFERGKFKISLDFHKRALNYCL